MRRTKMKKMNSKIAGLLVGSLGAIAALGGAFAVYVAEPGDKTINIGAATAKDVTLAVGTISTTGGDEENHKMQPGKDTVTYTFPVGFSKGAGSTYNQNVFDGRIEVTLSASTSELYNLLVASGTETKLLLDTEGTYYKGSDGTSWYWKTNSTLTPTTTAKEEIAASVVANAAEKKITFATDLPIPYAETIDSSALKCAVVVQAKGLSDANIVSISEASYTVDISLKDRASAKKCYVTGAMSDCAWGEVDKYLMTWNPKSTNLEYMYSINANNKLATGTEFKCRSGGDWSSGDNLTFKENTTGIYWDGNKYSSALVSPAS